MKLSVVCALLLLGCAMGCLGDPYYIDDDVDSAQTSSNAAIGVPSSMPTSSETASASTSNDDAARADASVVDTNAEPNLDSGTAAGNDTVSTDDTAALDDTASGDDPATVNDTVSGDDTAPVDDAAAADDTASADETAERDAAAVRSREASVPSTGAFVQGTCWPMCNQAEEDGVLDGWGTQYERSCVRQGTEAPACTYTDETAGFRVEGACYRPCPGPTLDDDGDGWAEDEGQTCVVTGSERATSAESCPYP